MSNQLPDNVYRTVLENLPAAVYIVDLQRIILFWNRKAEELTGFRSHEVLGRSCAEDILIHCDESCQILCGDGCPLLATAQDGTERTADVYLRHKEGQRIPVHVHATPVRDENGHVVAVAETVTERVPLSVAEQHQMQSVANDHTDRFTGVLDRGSIHGHIESALKDFFDNGVPFGVLSIGLDNLEGLRETIGARGSDAVLWATVRTVARNLSHADLIGRWDKNRFVALIADGRPADLAAAAESLRNLAAYTAVPWWGDRISPTISVGATTVRPADTMSAIMGRLEQAVGHSVTDGGNRVTQV